MTYSFYRLLLWLLVPFALLRLLIRARRQPAYLANVGERFGFYRQKAVRPVIWIHAVSVGEVRAAQPLIQALSQRHPDKQILVTNMTPTGRETSRDLFGDTILRCYLPYDLGPAVERFLRHFSPVSALVMETELWPTLVARCARRGAAIQLLNARLSDRSAKRYERFSTLSRRMLNQLKIICTQTERDAKRFRELGARHVQVTGNMKFDREAPEEQLKLGSQLRQLFGQQRQIFLAASTRDDEETLLLDAINNAGTTDFLTVIVPRHPQRFDSVADLLRRNNVSYQRRSDNQPIDTQTRVALGDSMGEMFAYYAACDVAFVGGSLLPLGGQNLLEACAVGKPVIVGPHTFNFEEATEQAIEAGAALRVDDAQMLVSTVSDLLADPVRAKQIGDAGRRFMAMHRGATERTLKAIGL
ncbi:MAG: lipid IV(A) 3-deoxy-D-manno-octulosonic acid transferase [Betaproteobacteria bacterium]|nr:MAG: lipid IV(A) 3-deoxy-D-manno-octulosonic acid transferase [Betaproteobacteria bacterium]